MRLDCSCTKTFELLRSTLFSIGPGEWKNMHGNEACGGNNQSPVNIPTSAPKSSSTERIIFSYGVPTGMTLKNNGHSGNFDCY